MIFKKTITIIISISFVIILNIYFTNILNNSIEKINEKLFEIEIGIQKNIKIEKTKFDELKNTWNEVKKQLALFIDHEELEKAELEIFLVEVNVEREDFDSAAEKIFNAKYMFTHMKEKNKLSIINIF